MDLESLKTFFAGAVYQLPLLVVCLGCLAVLGARWQQVGSGAVWAALGLGLTILLNITAPLIQTVAIRWASQNHNSVQDMLHGLSFLFSCLYAVSCGLLFAGVLAGRTAATGSPPSLPPDAYR